MFRHFIILISLTVCLDWPCFPIDHFMCAWKQCADGGRLPISASCFLWMWHISAIRSPLEAMVLLRLWVSKSIQFNNLHGMNVYQCSLWSNAIGNFIKFLSKVFHLIEMHSSRHSWFIQLALTRVFFFFSQSDSVNYVHIFIIIRWMSWVKLKVWSLQRDSMRFRM